MKFYLSIEMGNEAMRTDADLADALSSVIDRLDRGTTSGSINDVNGNTVGEFAIRDGDADSVVVAEDILAYNGIVKEES